MLKIRGWVLSEDVERVQEWLEEICGQLGIINPMVTVIDDPKLTPPTYFAVNKVTGAFFSLIDTYGVPRYREFNPAIPSIITFPFLFGVMYGDIVHGAIVFSVG